MHVFEKRVPLFVLEKRVDDFGFFWKHVFKVGWGVLFGKNVQDGGRLSSCLLAKDESKTVTCLCRTTLRRGGVVFFVKEWVQDVRLERQRRGRK